MLLSHPGRLFVERFGFVQSEDDVLEYARFLREESGLSSQPPVDLSCIYKRFNIPEPRRVSLPGLQGLLVNPELGMILINSRDIPTRQRFTEGHELMEMLFSVLPTGTGWAARRKVGMFSRSAKEQLCNRGAAELLMPTESFGLRVGQAGVSYETAKALALEYSVSETAALVQMARVGQGLHAVVLWRMKNKPSETKSRPCQDQLPLFGDIATESYPKRLRVEWSLGGPRTPYIPPDKSVPEDSSIYIAWRDGTFTIREDVLHLGTVTGTFLCESKPFEVGEEKQVVSLLHLPGDDCQCSESRLQCGQAVWTAMLFSL